MTIAMKEELSGSFCKKETANGSLTISVRYRDTDIGDTVSPTRYGKVISIMKDSFELQNYK